MRSVGQGRASVKFVFRGLVVGLMLGGATSALSAAPASAVEDSPSLGISKSFTENVVISGYPGQEIPPEQWIQVDNSGPRPAKVVWETQAPDGITISPATRKGTIESGGSLQIPFGVEIAETVAGGIYPVAINVKQVDVPMPKGGGIAFAPAVGANFAVRVSGAAATVILKAASSAGGFPVSGNFTLSQARGKAPPVVVATESGESLQARVAPGQYRGTFEIKGLTSESVDFAVNDGETKEVSIEVTTVSFAFAEALPQPNLGNITSAKLVSSLQNNLKKVDGPLHLSVEVSRDGHVLESVSIRDFDSLPNGLTDANGSYVPSQGWEPGQYDFKFVLKAPEFTISAPAREPIVIKQSWMLPLLIGLGVLAAVIAGLLLYRRRSGRRPPPPAAPPPPATVVAVPPHLSLPPPTGPAYPPPPDWRPPPS